MTEYDWALIEKIAENNGFVLQQFETIALRERETQLRIWEAAPISPHEPEWSESTRLFRRLVRCRAEEFVQTRQLFDKVRADLAELRTAVMASADPAAAIQALPMTAEDRIKDIVRIALAEQVNSLRIAALNEISLASTM